MLVAALCSTFAPLPSSTFTFAALIALATLVTVASLFPSPVFASVSPVVALVVKPPVTAFTLPVAVSTVMVALSVVTDTPSVPTVRPPLSFALTETPSPSTLIPPSVFALTETLLSAETEIPYPAVTGVLPPAVPPCGCSAVIVTMCLPCSSVVLVTVTPPSPLNSTSSPLFTVEVVLPAETFQPNLFNAVDKSPALTSFFLFASSGSVTLPSATVSSTVSATSLPSSPSPLLTFNPSPAFTLNLAERPVWSILTPSPSTK